jgi:hypothetical protein
MKRMAAQYPFKPQKKTPEQAVFPYRFVGIGGTTGYVSATGRKIW